MPTVAENVRRWSRHDWDHEGHGWSPGGSSSGTEVMWWRTIRPRVHRHLPAGTVLEIAPGFGRWTVHLLAECERVIGVDVTERCVAFCRERFTRRAEFHVNDGQSLAMVADGSIDFAFSFDSLVHAEAAPVRSYLHELARVLKPGATAFIHHSNLGAYADDAGAIPAYIRERYWRGASVSARLIRDACREAGLVCLTQELANWVGRDSDVERLGLEGRRVPLTDGFLACARPSGGDAAPFTRIYINRGFVDEWRQIEELTRAYGSSERHEEPRRSSAGQGGHRVPRGLRARLAGWMFEHREPFARAVMKGRCPDCGDRLTMVDGRRQCASCRTSFIVR